MVNDQTYIWCMAAWVNIRNSMPNKIFITLNRCTNNVGQGSLCYYSVKLQFQNIYHDIIFF